MAPVLKLPPPIWALVYELLAAAVSWLLGWPKLSGLPLPCLGILVVALGTVAPLLGHPTVSARRYRDKPDVTGEPQLVMTGP